MSRSLNEVKLIGNLGGFPEIRSTTGGRRVATFSLATGRSWRGANDEMQSKTEWHRCVAWNGDRGGLADVLEKYCKKGDKVYVSGRIEYRQWQDKENKTHYATEINVKELIMLSSANKGDASTSAPRGNKGESNSAPGGPDEFEDFPGALNDEEDDLPF